MVNFPQSFDDDDSLFLAVNNLRTQLTLDMTDSDTTATVVTTSGFPPTGYISILTGPDILDMEAITYSGTTDFTFLNLGRGADGTEAFLHNIGDNVDQTIVAQHHNELKDAIIILEEFVGVSGSENFVPKDQYGNVLISGALTLTTGTVTAGGGIFSDTLTISGAPVLTSLSENFVPKDQYGNVVITGTTSTYGLSVEGCAPADFKSDVTVSGGVVVGRIQPSSPVTTTSVSEDEPFALTADTGYEDVTGIDPLTVTTGTNLLLFRANGASTTPNAVNYRILYDGTDEVAEVIDGATSADDPSKHWQGVELAGFKVIDSDGSQEAVVQISRSGASLPVTMGAAAMTSIPLTELGLVENVDYWFHNGSDTPVYVPTGDTDLLTYSPTLPETGDYLVFGYCEGHDGDISGNGAIRYQLDGSDISPKYFIYTNGYVACPFVKLINIASGARTFTVVCNGGSTFGPSDNSYFLRGRFCIIKASSLNQVVQTRKSSTTTTSSTEFTQVPGTALTYTPPNVNETLLVLANPEFSNDVTDVNVTYQLVQSGTCQEKVYNVDAGGYLGGSPDNKPTLLFTVVEDAPLPTTWVLEHRSPEGGVAHTDDVSIIALGFTSPNPGTNYTTITDREVRSALGTFSSGIFSETLTISGVPVATGIAVLPPTFDPEDFVAKDEFGNVIISGSLTVSGGVELGATLVTGTLAVCEDADFKADVTVTGCITVGQPEQSGLPQAKYAFEDTTFNTTSTSYVETGVSIVPDEGINLVLFRENASAGALGSTSADLKVTYAGTDIGETEFGLTYDPGGHWNAAEMSGFKVIDTNNVDEVKLWGKASTSSRDIEVGAQQLISVPFETMGLVEGTDYWYDNGTDTPYAIPGASGSQTVLINDMDIDVPVTGPYLLLMHAEAGNSGFPTNNPHAVYLYANESNISNSVWRVGSNGSSVYHTHPWAQVVNLTAGTNNISVRARRWSGTGTFNVRRARMCVVNGSSFDQMEGTRTFTDYATSSAVFSEMSNLAITHTPNQQEQVLVLGSTVGFSSDITNVPSVPTYKIRDDTDGVDYAEDWGEPLYRAQPVNGSFFNQTGFAIKDDAVSAADWKMYIREANAQGNLVTSAHSAMVVWSLSFPVPTTTPLTTICKDLITTPELKADNISVINSGTLTVDIGGDIISPVGTFSESLTISGVPVPLEGGGGSGTITDINTTATGPSITITGVNGIDTITEGNTITISGTGAGGGSVSAYVHTQGAADTTWNITHGLGTEVVNYITLDNSNEQVYPDTFTVTDSNNVTIDWVAPQDGVAYIFGDTAVTQIGDLQFAYDSGDGSIVTVYGKPVLISGTAGDGDFDFKVIGSGIFTEALTIGEGTTYLDDHSITTASGVFSDSLTVSGSSVLTSDSIVGGGSALTVKEADGDPSVANVDTIVVSNTTLTDDGGGQVTISTGGGGTSLTVQEQDAVPTVTGVNTIKVTNSTLTDEGGGVVSIDTGGTGGGGGELTFSGAPRFLDPIRIWDARVPPNPPNTVSGTLYDDEFVGDVGDEIDTNRWSIFDPNSALSIDPPQIIIGDSVKLLPDGMPSFNSSVVGIYQDAPVGGLNTSITLYTYLNLNAYTSNTGATNSTDAYAGIIFLEDAAAPDTSNILLMGVHLGAREDTPSFAVGVWEYTAHSVTSPVSEPSTIYQDQFTNFGETGIYLKATYVGGATHRFDVAWSRDGKSWRIVATPDLESNLAMSTFNAFGLGGQFVNGYVYGADFSFFRALDSGNTWVECPAGYMYLERDPTASGLNVSGTISGTGGGGTALTVEEVDGVPSVSNVDTIKFTNGSVTDDGGGTVTVDVGSGGGGELTTSGMWFNVHALPESPSPYSDWFDDNSTNPTLSGSHPINWDKWTQWDVDTVSGTVTGDTMPAYEGTGSVYRDTNWMRINHDASTTGGWTGVYQATPDGSFTITTKVGIHGTYESNVDVRMGIFIADDLDGAPSTSELYSCSLYHVPGASVADTTGGGLYSQIEGALWTDYNSIISEVTTAAAPHPGTSAWLRLNYNITNDRVEAVISEDGINWKRLTYTVLGFTPSHMGFGIQKGTAGALNAAFEFFAVNDTVNSRAGATGYGRLVPIVISGTGGGGGSSVGQYTQAFTDQTVISVTHNAGSLVHFTTVLDESSFVVDAQIQYGENTDEVTLSELMSGSVVVLG